MECKCPHKGIVPPATHMLWFHRKRCACQSKEVESSTPACLAHAEKWMRQRRAPRKTPCGVCKQMSYVELREVVRV